MKQNGDNPQALGLQYFLPITILIEPIDPTVGLNKEREPDNIE